MGVLLRNTDSVHCQDGLRRAWNGNKTVYNPLVNGPKTDDNGHPNLGPFQSGPTTEMHGLRNGRSVLTLIRCMKRTRAVHVFLAKFSCVR